MNNNKITGASLHEMEAAVGSDTDAQVLVLYNMLGITLGHRAKFSHAFLAGHGSIQEAICTYVVAVKDGSFPDSEHSFQ
jgi:3-methyl-2-oxobutanoate hydroxymethyltransferase